MTPEEIAAVDPDLDSEDLNAIKTALLFNLGDFTDFRASITIYIYFCWASGGWVGCVGSVRRRLTDLRLKLIQSKTNLLAEATL